MYVRYEVGWMSGSVQNSGDRRPHQDGTGCDRRTWCGTRQGFSVDGQENIQEILSKQLYLCQCLTALNVVRAGESREVALKSPGRGVVRGETGEH